MKNKILSYTQKVLSLYGYQKAFHFFVYTILPQKRLLQWFAFIETKLPDSFSEETKTRLAMRPAFRFIRPWFSIPEKLDILTCHYTTLLTRLSPDGVSVLEREKRIPLAELTGRSGRKYTMLLAHHISKDGALTVAFRGDDIGRLASITGVIGPDKNNDLVFWIGALQGSTSIGGKREVVEETGGKKLVTDSTKDLNGLRPKQAVLHAVCALAEWFDVKKIIAPSLKNQIAIKDWRKKRTFYTDYDTFWEEYGKAEANGDYCLSLPLPRRQLADVQQKRRKDWILRYGRIDSLAASTVETFKKLQKNIE